MSHLSHEAKLFIVDAVVKGVLNKLKPWVRHILNNEHDYMSAQMRKHHLHLLVKEMEFLHPHSEYFLIYLELYHLFLYQPLAYYKCAVF